MGNQSPHIKSLLIAVAVLILFGLSCTRIFGRKFEINKTSPNGVYRVRIEFREEEPKGTRAYTERLTFRFFKGQDIVESYEAENSDEYEFSMRQGIEVVEWVGDNILHISEDSSDWQFYDELIVSNNTDENLKHISISYGRFQSFWVFDLAPGSKVTLRASPGFKQDGSFNYFLGYGGMTQSGKEFDGALEGKQRKSPADGPLKFTINISAKENNEAGAAPNKGMHPTPLKHTFYDSCAGRG